MQVEKATVNGEVVTPQEGKFWVLVDCTALGGVQTCEHSNQ